MRRSRRRGACAAASRATGELALTHHSPRARSQSEVDTVLDKVTPQQRFERSQSSRSSARTTVPAEDLQNRVVLTKEERSKIQIFGQRDADGDDEREDGDVRQDLKLFLRARPALWRGRTGGVLTGGGARTVG